MTTTHGLRILVVGNPFDGMTVFGPLTQDQIEVNVYGMFDRDEDWYIVDLVPPTEENDGTLSFLS